MALAPFLGFPGTGAPGDGDSLPPGQMMAVSHQFRRRGDAVAAVQQPAQVAAGVAQGVERTGAKRTFIFRIGAPVSGGPLHGFEFVSRIADPNTIALKPVEPNFLVSSLIIWAPSIPDPGEQRQPRRFDAGGGAAVKSVHELEGSK
jgi:hypothetical protein